MHACVRACLCYGFVMICNANIACVFILQGQLIGVVGKVGSGKTSLLSAITAEMCKVYGEVRMASHI